MAGGIFGLVTDETLSLFDDGRIEAALDALDADFFNGGAADFASLTGGDTIFDQIEFVSPDALVDLLNEQGTLGFFGGVLFGDN